MRVSLVAALVFLACLQCLETGAEQFAVHTSTVADGLAGDQVTCIAQDRQGYLWIGTRTGLSRFDGIEYRSFDTRDGLPHATIDSILEIRDGTLLVGTGRGLAKLLDEREPSGRIFAAVPGIRGSVAALAEDNDGQVWVAAGDTLYRSPGTEPLRFAAVAVTVPWHGSGGRVINGIVCDPDGSVWLATGIGLFRLLPSGTLLRYEFSAGFDTPNVDTLFRTRDGRLWVAALRVVAFRPSPSDEAIELAHGDTRFIAVRPARDGAGPRGTGSLWEVDQPLGEGPVFDFAEDSSGAVWAATYWGLATLGPHGRRMYTRSSGLVSDHVGSILVDDAGNIWIGTQSHGLMRINESGFTSFTEADGLIRRKTSAVTLGPDGNVVVVAYPPEDAIHVRDGDRFLALPIPVPGKDVRTGWGLNQVTAFDQRGRLWVPTASGLYRFPHLADLRDLPHTRYEKRYLPGHEVFRQFVDSRGDLWLGVFGDPRVVRWERATDTLHAYSAADGIPHESGTAFAEDTSGAVWIGFYTGGLARWRDGKFTYYDHAAGIPGGFVNCLLVDHEGRLWVGAQSDGLAVSDDPTADHPSWRLYTLSDGLSSAGIFSLAEDRFGRIYAGSLKGLDRLDPASGRIEHFDSSTGLVNNQVLSAIADARGDLWFATDDGVSRFHPSPPNNRPPPTVFIDRLTVDGDDLPIPMRGFRSVPRVFLPSDTERIDIGFTSVDLNPGARLRFEFSIIPGAEEWSPTLGERQVRLAGLAPGGHTVAIRARFAHGPPGPEATVGLQIASPIWRRWWFLVATVIAVAAAIWLIQHLRMRRLIELQNVRSRIASDLHDDMGLSLARVAMLAEVAGTFAEDTTVAQSLSEIGSTARDLVDATSDMAWALDPSHDSVAALVARLRRTASDVVEGIGAEFSFDADPLDDVPMGPEERRHLMLILKEAIRNACRHGRPDRVALSIRRRGPSLVLTVADDGVGFDPTAAAPGRGRVSMARRSREIGADLRIESTPGRGAVITLTVPLKTDA